MMWGYYYPGMSWWMVVSDLLWIALIGVAVWALVRFLARRTGARDGGQLPTGPSAEELLRQRYARGEIDAATFQQMQAELTATSPRDPALPGGYR